MSDPRRGFFEQEDFAARGSAWRELEDRHSDYIQLFVNSVAPPHTFDPAFGPAVLGPLDEDQLVVRLELLERAFSNSIYTYEDVVAAHRAGDRPLLDQFVAGWNEVRDARPAFATFLRDVQSEMAQPDWPELLRDRLGLAHYRPTGAPVRVALMCYSVREVLAEASSAASFTSPTVLDSTLWEHFFPAPREISYGRAMALSLCDSDESLVAEVLHSRISYKGGHIRMLGELVNPPPSVPIAELRDRHLMALQLASGREDFGA